MFLKTNLIHYLLIGLIIGFFAIPLTAVCLFDCKFNPARELASIFLLFFR